MNVIPTTAAVGGGSASGAPTGASGGTGVSASKTGNVAHVNFRVRCEGLGYGEEVFLVQDGDDKMQKVRLLFCVCRGGAGRSLSKQATGFEGVRSSHMVVVELSTPYIFFRSSSCIRTRFLTHNFTIL